MYQKQKGGPETHPYMLNSSFACNRTEVDCQEFEIVEKYEIKSTLHEQANAILQLHVIHVRLDPLQLAYLRQPDFSSGYCSQGVRLRFLPKRVQNLPPDQTRDVVHHVLKIPGSECEEISHDTRFVILQTYTRPHISLR